MKNLYFFSICFLFWICSAGTIYSQTKIDEDSKTLKGAVANAVLVQAELQNLVVQNNQYVSKGIVEVELDPMVELEDNLQEFPCQVVLEITFTPFGQLPVVTKQTFDLKYVRTYDPLNKYIAKAYYPIVGASSISVKFISNTNVPVNLEKIVVSTRLEASTNNTMSDVITSSLKVISDPKETGNLTVQWAPIPNADYYELEWTYVDNTKYNNGKPYEGAASAIEISPLLFQNNASKVLVKGLSFDIPMVYERGYILYRLRGASYALINDVIQPSFGPWTNEESQVSYFNVGAFPNYFYWEGHQRNVNWQSTISFAEEGKTKASIGYADGSLRTRQQITRNNSENKAIIGETIYDHEGRAAIQVLPVPINDIKLNLVPGFNKNEAEKTYSKSDFDLDITVKPGEECQSPSKPMDVDFGASNYYSGKNKFVNGVAGKKGEVVNRDLIPDAGKFPFTQTIYMSDNTGRVLKQTGVGDNFKLVLKHETRYIYSSPTREELIRMFGNEVGNHTHYQKNIVIDPNNQASISYQDMNGKTIATSIAGEPAKGTEGFSNLKVIKPDYIESDLFDDNNNSLAGINKKDPGANSKTFTKTIGVAYQSDYNFFYNAYTKSFLPTNCEKASPAPCYGCVLDIEMSLRERPCDPNLLAAMDNQKIGVAACTEKTNTVDKATVNLKSGGYTLTKKITVNKAALDAYEELFLKGECFEKFETFAAAEIEKLDYVECGTSCKDCSDRVDKLYGDGKISENERDGLKVQCTALCDPNFQCMAAYKAMLMDMSPDGQYGGVMFTKNIGTSGEVSIRADASGNLIEDPMPDFAGASTGGFPDLENVGIGDQVVLDPNKFELSVFSELNSLPVRESFKGRLPNWRFPYFKDEITKNEYKHYLLNDGSEYHVRVINTELDPTKPEKYSPEPKKGVIARKNDEDGSFWIYPEELAKVEEFIVRVWKPEFAKFLVDYHPEYMYYNFCIQNSASNGYDLKLLNAAQLADAYQIFPSANTTNFVPNPLDITKPDAERDPFFKILETQYQKESFAKMQYAMLNFQDNKGVNVNTVPAEPLTIWEFANMSANCPSGPEKCNTNCIEKNINTDGEWTRFVAFYISEKQKIVRAAAHNYAIPKGYYNGCIGNKNFQSSDDGFGNFIHKYSDPITHYYWGPCKNDNIVKKFGRLVKGGDCSRDWLSYTITGSPIYQFTNSEQSCNTYNHSKYYTKIPHFYPKDNSTALSGLQENCYQTVDINTGAVVDMSSNPAAGSFTTIKIACTEDKAALIQEAREEGERQLYNDCKQCPITRQFQNFLGEMVKTNEARKVNAKQSILATATDEQLNCFPEGLLNFTLEMEEAMIGKPVPKGDVINYKASQEAYGTGLPAAFKNVLTGTISQKFQNGTSADKGILKLTILPNTKGAAYTFKFDEITDICCIQEIKVESQVALPLTFSEGKNFKFKAKRLKTSDANDFPPEEDLVLSKFDTIEIQGMFVEAGRSQAVGSTEINTFKLSPCNLKPRCVTSNKSKYLMDLLSGLAVKQNFGTGDLSYLNKDHELGKTVDFNLNLDKGIVDYQSLVRRLAEKTELKKIEQIIDYRDPLPATCNWVGTATGSPVSEIKGVLDCGMPNTEQGKCDVKLNIPSIIGNPTVQAVENVISFGNIRLNKDIVIDVPSVTPGYTNTVSTNFLVDMIVEVPGATAENKYQVVKNVAGFTNCFYSGTCTSIIE